MTARGRFAPSTTGPAHPGTLLAALLAWLDIRARGGELVLRYEDLDPSRCRPAWLQQMREALLWLGLDWDREHTQSDSRLEHAAALDELASRGLLYPCACSRADMKALGRRGPDGGWAYSNTCRARSVSPAGWRACDEPLRVRLVDGQVHLTDESGADLSQDPAAQLGDPVVRRRDGAVAYNLAVVVDDAHHRINRVVRGRDIAPSTATQVLLHGMLGLEAPSYRHHLLLLEPRGRKFAKLHGSVAWSQLMPHYDGASLCGLLAHSAGLLDRAEPVSPNDLVGEFSWSRVAHMDRVMHWEPEQGRLKLSPTAHAVDRDE